MKFRKTTMKANLRKRVPFKNNLRDGVCFKRNNGGGMIFTCNPPLLLAASLYRYRQQRDAGGIAIGISDTLVSPLVAAEQKLSHSACRYSSWRYMLTKHVAIRTGGTCQRGQSRHWCLRDQVSIVLH